jgi:hypothetical protein
MILLANFLIAQKNICVPENVVAVLICSTLDRTAFKTDHGHVYTYVTFLPDLAVHRTRVKMLRKLHVEGSELGSY